MRCTRRPSSASPRTGCTSSRAQAGKTREAWLAQLVDWQRDARDPGEFMDTLRVDLFSDEVYVFTPKGEVKSLPVGATPLDFAYAVHTDVGHRCVGAKVNGRIVPLHYTLQSGEFVEVLTSKQDRGPSRDWLNLVKTSRARNKIRQFFTQQQREDLEHGPRVAAAGAQVERPAASEGVGLAAPGRDHPRDGLQEGRRLLRCDRRRQDPGRAGRVQADGRLKTAEVVSPDAG